MTRIAHVTDLHIDDFLSDYYQIDARRNLSMVLSHIKQNCINGIVITGDLGDEKSHKWLFSQLRRTRLPYEIILGNHDRLANFSQFDWLKAKVKPSGLFFTTSLGFGDWIFLDSRTGEIDKNQIRWLSEEIHTREDLNDIIVFIHHPILDCGNSAMDRQSPLKNREQVRCILEEYGGKAIVFCGHYHNHQTQERKNITQHLTPSCLMQLRLDSEDIQLESKQIGYRVIEFEGSRMKTWYEMMAAR